MELSSILSKVRSAIELAERPDTPVHEANAAREMADRLMLKYAIDQATLRDSVPAEQKAKPAKIKVDVCEAGSLYEDMFTSLVVVVCEHTRTQCIFSGAQMDADVMRAWEAAYGKRPTMAAKVYGFESDLKYFEILYTTLLLHMSNGIDPKPDVTLSDADNAYALHTGGLNWLEIARLYFRMGHEYGWDGDKNTYHRCGGYWKRQYRKALRERDEEFIHHPARFTDEQRANWRLNFAKSYVATIRERLWLARSGRTAGSELVLQSSMDAIREMLQADAPGAKFLAPAKEVEYNAKAWGAGDRHAKSADLGGNPLTRKVAGEL